MAPEKNQSRSEKPAKAAPRRARAVESLPLSKMTGGLPEHHVQGDGFLLASRRARRGPDDAKRSREKCESNFSSLLSANVDVLAEHESSGEGGRKIFHFQGDLDEVVAKAHHVSPDVILEAKLPRYLASAIPQEVRELQARHGNETLPAGTGDALNLTLEAAGRAVVAADVTLYLLNAQGRATSVNARTDERGRVRFEYAARDLRPVAAMIEPDGGAWPKVHRNPVDGDVVQLPALELEGPVGWWHLLSGGADELDPAAGAGIKIGVVDTGVGPHPFLEHVRGLGAAIDGSFTAGAAAARDFKNHGTHVCGIIGARPDGESKGFAGIAPGADLACIRVFNGPRANQGDIAAAVDHFAFDEPVDLVNLSLGGPPSPLEADAILAAFEAGTLCICAAGNENGAPVLSPASLPYTAAISAVGIQNVYPPDSVSASNLPRTPDKFASNGVFLCGFSNVGNQVSATAAGNAIISTVPVRGSDRTPYLPMDGTSMATPVTTGALAVLLSENRSFAEASRGAARSSMALAALVQNAMTLGLPAIYQGAGLCRSVARTPVLT